MSKLCEMCGEPATTLCLECNKCYCDECCEFVHKKKTKSGHKPEKISTNVEIDTKCPIHQDEPLKYFCLDDFKLCCSTCIVEGDHKGHKLMKFDELLANGPTSLETVSSTFEDTLTRVEKLKDKIEDEVVVLGNNVKATRESIAVYFKGLHDELTARENALAAQLEGVLESTKADLSVHIKTLEGSIQDNDRIRRGKNEETLDNNLKKATYVSRMEEGKKNMNTLLATLIQSIETSFVKGELCTKNLFVSGTPKPRKIVIGDVASGSVEIGWESECKDGMKYRVEMHKKGEPVETYKIVYEGPKSSCKIVGLESNTKYEFRVCCVIGDTASEWSEIAEIETKESLIKGFERAIAEWCGPSKLALIYRGSSDGMTAADFHAKCDNKGQTITLIRNNKGHIFGAYTSIPWTSDGYYHPAPGTFLFSLTSMYDTQPAKFPLKDENDACAVCHCKDYGPWFGNNGNDIAIYSPFGTNARTNSWFFGTNSYNDTTGKGKSIFSSNAADNHFTVTEMEVYTITK